MSEIKIVLDAFTQSDSLDKTISQLESVVTLTDQIKKNKDLLNASESSANTAKLTAETQKLLQETEKLRRENKRKHDEEKKAATEQSGLIGDLIQKQRTLNTSIRAAKSVDEIKKLNSELSKTNGELKKLQTLGKTSTNTFGKALDSFAFKFNFLGNLVANFAVAAINKMKQFAKESITAFLDAEATANKLEFAIKNIAGEGAGGLQRLINQSEKLQKQSIFSDDDIQKAQTALVQYGLTTTQVEKLIPKILDLASAQGIDLASATDKVIGGINGQVKGLKDAGIQFDDTGSKTKNLGILMDKLSKFTGSAADQLNTAAGQAKFVENELNNLQEQIGEELAPIWSKLQIVILGATNAYIDFFKTTDALTKIQDKQNETINATAEAYVNLTEKQLEAQLLFDNKEIVRINKERLDAIKEGNKEEEKRLLNFQLQVIAEKKGIQQLIEERKKLQKVRDDSTGKDVKDEKIKKLDEIEPIYISREVKLNKEINKVSEAQIEHEERLREQEAAAEKRAYDEKIDLLNKYSSALFDALEERNRKKQEAIDKEINSQEDAINRQQELADRGLSNTLAFEERKKAELEKARIDEQRKLERLKKIEAYFNAFAAYSKDDPKTAAGKALRDVAIATAFSLAFAEDGGIVGDIAEPIAGGRIANGIFKGRSHKQGGILLEAEGDEGIFSKKEMRNLGRDNFYSIKEMLKNPINDDIFERQNAAFISSAPVIIEQKNDELIAEIKDLKQVIKNKREFYIDYDKQANMIVTKIENGIKEVTEKKMRKPRI